MINSIHRGRKSEMLMKFLRRAYIELLGNSFGRLGKSLFGRPTHCTSNSKLDCLGARKIHLGCGRNYLKGWLNVDLDSPVADSRADLRNPLPFADESVDFIFNEHFLEHITREEGIVFLKECRRVLKPGGVFRVSTPDLKWLVFQYGSGRIDEWSDVDWLPATPCRMLNEGMRLWGHQFVYDLPELLAALSEAGFLNISQVGYRESSRVELIGLECRPWHRELILEAY
jgi:predicted SAM-dependent methyltransferase